MSKITLSDAIAKKTIIDECDGTEKVVLSYTTADGNNGMASVPVSYFNTGSSSISGDTVYASYISRYTIYNNLMANLGMFGFDENLYNLLNQYKSKEIIGPINYNDFISLYFAPIYAFDISISYNGKWNNSGKSETDCKQDLMYVLCKYLEQGRFIFTYINNDALATSACKKLLYITDYSTNYYCDDYIDQSYFGVVTYCKTGSDISKNDICYTISSFSFSYICYNNTKTNIIPRRDITFILNTSGVYISYEDITDGISNIINRKFI